MVLLIAAFVLSALGVGMFTQRLVEEKDAIRHEALKLDRDLANTVSLLEAVTQERDELVNERIPGLQSLAYDETILVSRKYVRNIVFTLANKNASPSYEYRVVLSNDGLATVIPDVRVLMFDPLGVQLGIAEITVDSMDNGEGEFTLEPGEVRTHSGTIQFFSADEPQYFRLHIN